MAGVLAGILLGSFVFMAFDNTPPYLYDVDKSYVVPSPAREGDQITVKWRIKEIRQICPGSVQRLLIDTKTGIIVAAYDPTPAATSESIQDGYLNRTFALPRSLPTGKLAYRANVCYQCNAFQKLIKPLCTSTPTLYFELQ